MADLELRIKTYDRLDKGRLDSILNGIRKIRAALIGDICLDVYWRADMKKSELSRETPHFPLPVVEEWASPGGGGNAAANIAALEPEKLYIMGVIGQDWRGMLLKSELTARNMDTGYIIASSARITDAYCKPLRRGISDVEYEDPRIDFTNYKRMPSREEGELIRLLDEISGKIDVLCVSDQMKFGCITEPVREKIIGLGRQGLRVVVDSRDRISHYRHVTLKPNEMEGHKAVCGEYGGAGLALNDHARMAAALSSKNSANVCMTLGKNGCIYIEGQKVTHVPSYDVGQPMDTCGAGDTFLAAFSCALAAGAAGHEAAAFANMAADVTIKKIGITGTASPGEIITRHSEVLDRRETGEA